MVDQIADIERGRQRTLLADQGTYELKKSLLSSIGGKLESLENKAEALANTELYDSRTVNSSETHLTASASAGTASGDYQFDIYQMATTAKQLGTSRMEYSHATAWPPSACGAERTSGARRRSCRCCSARSCRGTKPAGRAEV